MEPSLLQDESTQLSQPLLTGQVLQPSDHVSGLPLSLLQQVHVFVMLRALRAGHSVSEEVLEERTVSAHYCLISSFPLTCTPNTFFTGLLLNPQMILILEALQPRSRTLYLALLNLVRFT